MQRSEPLRAGRLREQVEAQRENMIDNGRGGRKAGDPPWVAVRGARAEIIALRGDEAMRSAVERTVQMWRVEMRPFPGLTTKHRLLWGDLPMDIKSIAPNALRDGIVLTCESGLPT